MIKRAWYFILFIIITTSCSDDTPKPLTPVVLTESELVATMKLDEIKDFITSTGLPISDDELKYGVDIYKVEYRSEYKSGEVKASGLVVLPKTGDAVPIVSFQRGTISAHRDAPSSITQDDDLLNFYAALASVGFVNVIPDLFGFGASSDLVHPYYVEEPTADAVLDNIRAARELALVNGRNLNKKLFLAGYSQGGYATLAAHKAIEANGVEDLNLVASFPAAGGYDIKKVQEYFFQQEIYDQPFYIAFVAAAYKSYYEWDQSLDIMFQEPYASRIPTLFDGTLSGSQVNAQLTSEIPNLLTPGILSGIDTDPQYQFIVDAFNENSLTDWVPTNPVYMYHGTSDVTVPYENSVATYNTFIQNGASTSVVTFTPLHFANHSTGIIPYILELTNRLLAMK